jgi:hypothetical protein
MASKALLYGSLLCFGSFSAATAIFVKTTGITSAKEFSDYAGRAFSQVDALDYNTETSQRQGDEELEQDQSGTSPKNTSDEAMGTKKETSTSRMKKSKEDTRPSPSSHPVATGNQSEEVLKVR